MKKLIVLFLFVSTVALSGFVLDLGNIDKFYGKNAEWENWYRFSYCEIDATEAMMMYAGSGVTVAPANYNFLSTNTTINISSSSTADTGEIELLYMNEDFEDTSARVTMTGQTPITVSGIRMIRMKYVNDVSKTNTGDIYAYTGTNSSGVPSDTNKILIAIPAGKCTTQGTVTTTSADLCCGFVHGIYINGAGQASQFWLNVRDNNYANPTIQKVGPFTTIAGGDYFESDFQIKIGPKTDVFLTGKAGTVNQSFLTGYNLVYRKE